MERRKASPEQLNMLLQFLEGDKELAIGRFTGLDGKIRQTNAWIKITEKLNANSGFGSGAMKTPDKWQQTWRDWKSNVKKKAFKLRKQRFAPGSGGQFTEAEEKILRLICGNTSVFGLPGVPETGVTNNADLNVSGQKPDSVTNGTNMYPPDPSTSNMYDPTTMELGGIEDEVGMQENPLLATNEVSVDGRPVWKRTRPYRMVHDKLLNLEEEKIKVEKQKLLEKKRCNNIRIKIERDKLELERQRNNLLERLLTAVESLRRQ